MIPDETSIRAQTNQDNRGNKTCIFRNGQIFESLFKSLTPTCLNWRSDLSLQTIDAGVHSFIHVLGDACRLSGSPRPRGCISVSHLKPHMSDH